jgi:hypothetical protein
MHESTKILRIKGRKLALFTVALWLGIQCPFATAGQGGKHLPAGLQELADSELDSIRAAGLYFRMDMSMEVFTPGDTTPQVVLNTTDPIVVPTDSTGTVSGNGSVGGNITLAGNAQSGISSLVNVIGSGSVINIGVNVINLSSSTNDTIYTTNTNVGLLGGSSSTPSIQLPVTLP